MLCVREATCASTRPTFSTAANLVQEPYCLDVDNYRFIYMGHLQKTMLGLWGPPGFERLGVKRTLEVMAVLVPGPVALHPLGRVEVTGAGENTKVAHSFRKPA